LKLLCATQSKPSRIACMAACSVREPRQKQNVSKDVDIALTALGCLLTEICNFSLYTWLWVSRGEQDKKRKSRMERAGSDSIHAQIAIRAYQRWQRRGCPIGSPEEDWIHAEEELRLLLDVQRFPFSSISMGVETALKYDVSSK
jgi:hypothetical protein